MHQLAKDHIHLPSKVLNDAIILPKDGSGKADSYPSEKATLFHNPYGTSEYKAEEARKYKDFLKEQKIADKLAKAAAAKIKLTKGKKGKKGEKSEDQSRAVSRAKSR